MNLLYIQIEFYFQALLSNDHQDHHLDPYENIDVNFDEKAALIMNRSLLREIFLSKQIFNGMYFNDKPITCLKFNIKD